MRIKIVYPPKAYPYMPYLAPFLLKGYVEQNSNHRVHCEDLNILYSNYLCGAEHLGDSLAFMKKANSREGQVKFEFLARYANVCRDALRDDRTFLYGNVEEIRKI